MSNDQNNNDINKQRNVKKLAAAQVKHLTQEIVGDSDWTLLQIILQEIVATFICEDKPRPSVEKLVEFLSEEVELRYKEDERVKDILLAGIPSRVAVSVWLKKEGWDEAVWQSIKSSGLFTAERRASIIDALYQRGKDKSDTAAKLWLTMSGDYSDKLDVSSDNTIDQFREIQQALLSKKNQADGAE